MDIVSPERVNIHIACSFEPSIANAAPQPEQRIGMVGIVKSPEAPMVELNLLSQPDSQSRIASSV